jgi:hypothetical protein
MLDDLELPLVQSLHTVEDQVWVEHGIPALAGPLLQRLGRAATCIQIEGLIVGPDALGTLETLRNLYHDAQPVPFTADIMTATLVTQVMIDNLMVRELAGRPERFYYLIDLVEFEPTPEPVVPPGPEPPEPPEECVDQKGRISVTVTLPPGQTDFTGVVVRLQKTGDPNAPFIEITEHTNGVFSRDGLDPGEFRATAFRRP